MPHGRHVLPVAALALGAVAAIDPVRSQERPEQRPPVELGSDARYSFHRDGDNFVRLDGRTGQVSICGREAAGWTCRAIPNERAALEESIDRLQSDNAALKRELLAKGLPLPGGVKPDAPAAVGEPGQAKGAGKPGEGLKLPSDADVDRVLGFVERLWRRLVEMMADFQRDIQRKG